MVHRHAWYLMLLLDQSFEDCQETMNIQVCYDDWQKLEPVLLSNPGFNCFTKSYSILLIVRIKFGLSITGLELELLIRCIFDLSGHNLSSRSSREIDEPMLPSLKSVLLMLVSILTGENDPEL